MVADVRRAQDGGVGDHEAVQAVLERDGSDVVFVRGRQVRRQLHEQRRRPLLAPVHGVPGRLHALHQVVQLFPPLQRSQT